MLFSQLWRLCCALQPRSGRFPLELAGCLNTGAGGIENGERFVLRWKETEMVRRMKPDSPMSWLEQRERADLSKSDSISEEGKQAASGCLKLPILVMSIEDVRMEREKPRRQDSLLEWFSEVEFSPHVGWLCAWFEPLPMRVRGSGDGEWGANNSGVRWAWQTLCTEPYIQKCFMNMAIQSWFEPAMTRRVWGWMGSEAMD